MARLLNRILGVTTITPWELGGIPDVWIALVVEGVNLKAELAEAGIGGN